MGIVGASKLKRFKINMTEIAVISALTICIGMALMHLVFENIFYRIYGNNYNIFSARTYILTGAVVYGCIIVLTSAVVFVCNRVELKELLRRTNND